MAVMEYGRCKIGVRKINVTRETEVEESKDDVGERNEVN